MGGFCGFTGVIEGSDEVINAMTERIKHRGPDLCDIYSDDDITVSVRSQTVVGGSVILAADGGDADEILRLYNEHGTDMLCHLTGLFSFVLYDAEKELLFAARDRFGAKPFYYSPTADGNLLFGSEIKSFLPHPSFTPELNEYALEQYLTFQYSVLDETFFKGVYKLPPAHYLIFSNRNVRVGEYYCLMFAPEPAEPEAESVAGEIEAAVTESLSRLADAETGAFLSGGVDSGYLAARFKGGKTFTVGYEENKYSEVKLAEELSRELGVTNVSKIITPDEYFGALPTVQYHMDEPLADPAAVAFYFASKLAAEHVKTALSGEGPDELFGGYNIYREPLSLAKVNFIPKRLRRWLGKIAARVPFSFKGKNFLIRAGKTVEERFFGNAKIFTKSEREEILRSFTGRPPEDITLPLYNEVKAADDITKMQYIDIKLWLPGDILLQADKMSMAHSLDVRMPYLTEDILNIALKTPTRLRVNKTGTKYAFRQAAAKYLPKEAAARKKLGFPVPIRVWLKEEKYYRFTEAYFHNEAAQRYFHTDKLDKLLSDHKSGTADNSRKIWTVLSFLVWHERFLGTGFNISGNPSGNAFLASGYMGGVR